MPLEISPPGDLNLTPPRIRNNSYSEQERDFIFLQDLILSYQPIGRLIWLEQKNQLQKIIR